MTFTTVAIAALAAAGITTPSAQLIASVAFTTDVIFHTGVGMDAAAAEAVATWADMA